MPDRCVVRDANVGHQLAGGNSNWCPELESWTTPVSWTGKIETSRGAFSSTRSFFRRQTTAAARSRRMMSTCKSSHPERRIRFCGRGVSQRVEPCRSVLGGRPPQA